LSTGAGRFAGASAGGTGAVGVGRLVIFVGKGEALAPCLSGDEFVLPTDTAGGRYCSPGT